MTKQGGFKRANIYIEKKKKKKKIKSSDFIRDNVKKLLHREQNQIKILLHFTCTVQYHENKAQINGRLDRTHNFVAKRLSIADGSIKLFSEGVMRFCCVSTF